MLMFRPLLRYAVFRGRARRAEYWLFVLFQGVVVGGCLAMAIGSLDNPQNPGVAFGNFMKWLGLYGLASTVLFVPYLAVLARRLHDIGQTAWWMLLMLPGALWPFLAGQNMAGAFRRINAGVAESEAAAIFVQAFSQSMLIILIAGACSLGLMVMTVLPGTQGPNRFGPDPRNPDAPAPDRTTSSVYDERRLEELFEEAKRARGGGHEAPAAQASSYAPVFDFGPGPTRQPEPAPEPRQPSWDAGIAPARPFGRRGA
ncbi:uncharacterized membrane protein YhaH (DUF805 family) [Brevundimonas alba]|uniref:Uncharacterized membrane protein YhaH (DUF805 family) n=1 Tax=Brevundimonas alba TaxID=74314 RepID=A0A7X6BMJ5_9CAUL|nr:DUF805 domain-containing protein [Brevundimonas alba]NJC41123.1 uncharacterized membrane protein YhaH (DUF805 family) [Brevundimonas alba]